MYQTNKNYLAAIGVSVLSLFGATVYYGDYGVWVGIYLFLAINVMYRYFRDMSFEKEEK